MRRLLVALLLVALAAPASGAGYVYNDGNGSTVSPYKKDPPSYKWNIPGLKCIGTFIGHSLLKLDCGDGFRVLIYREDDHIIATYSGKTKQYAMDNAMSEMYMAAFNHAEKIRK